MEKFATNQRFPRQKDEGLQFTWKVLKIFQSSTALTD